MRKEIGLVICNYNRRDAVVDCIQSVLESRVQNFDIIMVDNASKDGSVKAVLDKFGNNVTILCNKENKGGSGGFNTGIKYVLEQNYPYLCCLDNDVCVDENAIEVLHHYLEENEQVGMAGSKVFYKQMPNIVQQFGLLIDFSHFCLKTNGEGKQIEDNRQKVFECDAVAACSVMLPTRIVREIGMLPEDNFLYWDDIEWGYKVRLAGYRVVALEESKVLHEMGAIQHNSNTTAAYYHFRNGLYFFMKYTPSSLLAQMSVSKLSEIYEAAYDALLREEHGLARTIMMAYFDALSGIRGRINGNRVYPIVSRQGNPEQVLLENKGFGLELFLYFNQPLFLMRIQEMRNMKIVNATIEDEAEVLSLYQQSKKVEGCTWNEDYPSVEDFRKDVKADNLFVLRDENQKIISVISIDQDELVQNLPFFHGKHTGELARLAVRQDMQNQGIARQMIYGAMQKLRERGCDYMHYLVSPYNKRAMSSYAKLGFFYVGDSDLYGQKWKCYEIKL